MAWAAQCMTRFGLIAVLGTSIIAGGDLALSAAVSRPDSGADPAARRVREAYGRLPLSFERNRGQIDPKVKFLSRGSGYTFFLTPDEAVMVLRSTPAVKGNETGPGASSRKIPAREKTARSTVLQMRMVGANPRTALRGLDELPGKSNYFIGKDPGKWRMGVPNFGKVRYEGVYSGIDLIFHGNQRQLEYDFVVAAGADPGNIRLAWNGAKRLAVDEHGNLVLYVAGGRVIHHAPVVYQNMDGARREIRGHYVLRGNNQVGFRVAAYDRRRALVIDPVLVYSTYLGGSSSDEDGNSIAVDVSGNAYVTGYTYSINFPTASPLQAANGGSYDAFVAKLDASGSVLSYSTYLGGSSGDYGQGIAVDVSGNAYVTGYTLSTDFPTASPLQAASAGAPDAFVTKLDVSGSALSYSTYLGGSSDDHGQGIAVDVSGNAYVAGYTYSTDFPTASPFQPASGGGGGTDAFVTKLTASGSTLSYSTYLGGSDNDAAYGIAVDGSGNAYVTGSTESTDFPTANPFQATRSDIIFEDAFVTKLNASGSSLSYSTYLGGLSTDVGNGIAVDLSGNAYVTGYTYSSNFPTANPFQATSPGGGDAFVTKLDAPGSALSYSTFLGGSSDDYGQGIAVDASGNAYVAGYTFSSNFSLASPFQAALSGGLDAFVTKLDASGSALAYSTYLGGSSYDFALGIAVDGSGNAYATGYTQSTNFPTVGPLQAAIAGHQDVFVAKIGETQTQVPTLDFAGLGLLMLGLLAAGRRLLRRA